MTRTLVICGLRREAVCATAPNVTIVVSGGSRAALEDRLSAVDPTSIDAVVSFGLAGGLDPILAVGDVVIASEVWTEKRVYPTSPDLTGSWRRRIHRGTLPFASAGSIAGVDRPLATPAGKASLHQRSGSVAVDMESHIAAAYASRHNLPFGALRVISDGANRTIPAAAIAAMRDDGGVDIPAALRSLIRQPAQLPALVATAWDGSRAFEVLRHAGKLLHFDPAQPD